MLDKFLIRHSAPTLAGLKTANLFWYPWEKEEEFREVLSQWRKIFQEKGLDLHVMKVNGHRALLYVFRVGKLDEELKREKTRAILKTQGYCYETAEEAIEILKDRMGDEGEFPHEVGLFLGYPEDDVWGFMVNQGKNCKCCGCWKVYCDECSAMKTFCKSQKCEEVYQRLFLAGKPVRQLIVAA